MKKKIKILPLVFLLFLFTHFVSARISFGKNVAVEYIGGNNKGNIVNSLKYEIKQILTKQEDVNLYEAHKESYITINGLVQKIFGNKIINDAEVSNDVVKLKNGQLTGYTHSLFTEEKLKKYSKDIDEFSKYLNNNETGFIYVQIPSKTSGDSQQLPAIITDYTDRSFNQIISVFEGKNVNVLDLRSKIKEQKIDIYSLFYKTDHHWNSFAGRWAANEIGAVMNSDYGFTLDLSRLDQENFYLNKNPKKFLGSWGKRVGPLYAGVDDFDILIPKYETSFVYKYNDITRTGSFEEALIDYSFFSGNYYQRFTYCTFLSGNFAFINIHNNNFLCDKSVLCIVNSYSCALLPYMALSGYKDIYAIDPRVNSFSAKYYVDKYKPDVVIYMMNTDYDSVTLIK